MSENPVVSVRKDGAIAWVTVNNPPVNATSTAVRAGLEKAVAEVAGAQLAVLECAGRTFVAGGDMSEFDAPPALPHLPDVYQLIEDSPVPFLALLHGNVLGGGLELALACAWRFAAPKTGFGLPEVNVGLIPGAGGTQRLPRLVGMDAAMDMACSGVILKADKMLTLGGIDRIVDGDLADAARSFATDLPERPVAISQRDVPPFEAAMVDAKRAAIAKKAKGQKSPLLNLDALLWAVEPFSVGQPKERALHLELRHTPESRALRHAFFAERAVSKPTAIKGVEARDIASAVVVGGGLMGAGIATSMLNAGLSVTLIERDTDAAAAAQDRVTGLVSSALKRGKVTEAQVAERLSRFATTDDYARAAGADLAIEAVFEDVAVKQEVFGKLARVMDDQAILATNTSYLDPQLIFAGIANPARCLGLHFFSPAHVMKLLEIVKTPDTSAEVLASGFALGKKMRKVSVLSGICDGFIGNRMLSVYRRAADYLLADGALPHEIDAAMRDFGMPMGPYELQDLTGLQIAWANRKRQAATRDPAERYVPVADRLCELDRLGQRAGKGWYDYADGDRTPRRSAEVEDIVTAYSAEAGITRRSFDAAEIASRLMAVLANEGARIVEEGIAETDAAVDVVKMQGYGFPRWRGGPMQYAQETGWAETARVMTALAAEAPGSWVLADRIRKAADRAA